MRCPRRMGRRDLPFARIDNDPIFQEIFRQADVIPGAEPTITPARGGGGLQRIVAAHPDETVMLRRARRRIATSTAPPTPGASRPVADNASISEVVVGVDRAVPSAAYKQRRHPPHVTLDHAEQRPPRACARKPTRIQGWRRFVSRGQPCPRLRRGAPMSAARRSGSLRTFVMEPRSARCRFGSCSPGCRARCSARRNAPEVVDPAEPGQRAAQRAAKLRRELPGSSCRGEAGIQRVVAAQSAEPVQWR